MEEGQPSLSRSRVSVEFFLKIYFRLYERRASPPWLDLAIDLPEISPRRAGNLPYKRT